MTRHDDAQLTGSSVTVINFGANAISIDSRPLAASIKAKSVSMVEATVTTGCVHLLIQENP